MGWGGGGAGGRTQRGQDSVSDRSQLLSSLPSLLPRSGRVPCVGSFFLFFFCRPLPPSLFPPFHIFITPPAASISPLCAGRGPHRVSHSRSINDQLEHGATQSPPPPHPPQPPPPPAPPLPLPHPHPHTLTHTFQLFLPPLKTSQRFFFFFFISSSFPFSLPLPLPPVDGSPQAHHTFS